MFKKAIIRQLSKTNKNKQPEITPERRDSVAILSLYEKDSELQELKAELEQLGKSPRLLAFVNQVDKNEEYPSHTFNSKHIGLTGNILSEEIQYFTKQHYDYLICLDDSGNDFIKYLLSKTSAQHRIGFYNPNFEGLIDFMIKTEPKHSPINELLKYMKMIKK
ncbi:MAG: DUF6913 domain-containing protein [Cyclobacteriaceae bacterium]